MRIAVAHGQVVGFGDEVGATLSVDAVGRAVGKRLVHYVAVGDSHSTARLDDDGRMWFSGSPETTDYDDKERDSGNVLLVEVGPDTAPTVEDIAVGAWRFRAMRREFAGAEDAERWIEELRLLTDKSRTCVKYSLSGTLNLSEKGELDRALAELAPSFAALYQRGSGTDVTVLPEDGDITALGLNGFPLDAAETLRDMANDEAVDAEQRRAATDALGLLARLVGQGN